MGCTSAKSIEEEADHNLKSSCHSSDDVSFAKEHYTLHQSSIPDRIKVLYHHHIQNETTKILHIDLKFLNLSPVHFRHLDLILPYFTKITILNLWKTKLGNEGCITLSSHLHNFSSLEFLSLADNQITCTGIKPLAETFPVLIKLKTLELHVNPFDNLATLLLAQNLGYLGALKILCLDECGLGGESLGKLVNALLNMNSLERISLDYNFFSEENLKLLKENSKKLKNLKRMSLQNVEVNFDMQQEFTDSSPHILFSF